MVLYSNPCSLSALFSACLPQGTCVHKYVIVSYQKVMLWGPPGMVHSPAESTGLGSINKTETIWRGKGDKSPRAKHHLFQPIPKSRSCLQIVLLEQFLQAHSPRWWCRGQEPRVAKSKCSPPGRSKVWPFQVLSTLSSWGKLLPSEAQARFQGRKPSHYRWRMGSQDPKTQPEMPFLPGVQLSKNLWDISSPQIGEINNNTATESNPCEVWTPKLCREIQSGRLYPSRVKLKSIHSSPFV